MWGQSNWTASNWTRSNWFEPHSHHRPRKHRPFILPIQDGSTLPLFSKANSSAGLRRPQGYTTPTPYLPPLPELLPIAPGRVFVEIPKRIVAREVSIRGIAIVNAAVAGAQIAALQPIAGATSRALHVASQIGTHLEAVVAAGVCSTVRALAVSCGGLPPAEAIENPTDEEIVLLLLKARRNRRLTKW
jgi:hypothetical protein